ncbi:MAG: phytanoyl-CoA dioxygenase family protein, partial [Pseudomonadota bacterium]
MDEVYPEHDLECLTPAQVAFYNDNGYLLLESRLPREVLDHAHAEVAAFREEARTLRESSDRIDLEASHTPEEPRIRRIKLPHLNSPFFDELMRSDLILAPARDLLGPHLRLHTSKLNMKSARYGAPVQWHQDFAFYPHTNDDLLAIGVMLDDVDEENGPLLVFPGTHKGPLYDHHHHGVFA